MHHGQGISEGTSLARSETDLTPALHAAARQDPAGFRQLYDLLAPSVVGYLRGLNTVDPEDLTSEVFLRVFRAIPGFRGGPEAFRSWVFTIAHHLAVDDLRRRGARPDLVLVGDGLPEHGQAGFETDLLERLGDGAVRAALDSLSPAQRDVLLLRVVVGLSARETADVVGKRVGAVKSLHQRALAAMRVWLDGSGHGPGEDR